MMSEEEQQIAIAEICGIKCMYCNNTGVKKETSFSDSTKEIESPCRHPYLPKYLNDLNAIQEAVKTLSMGQLVIYARCLNKMELSPTNYGYVEQVINAGATQRAKALLEATGKWTE